MKKKITMLVILFIGLNTSAQIKFEKGYIITNGGVKTECLIKNEDWNNNPTIFEYKLSETSKTKIGNLKTIKEFSIYNAHNYQAYTVKIDKSSSDLNKISFSRASSFDSETLFLKLLVSGTANLFSYKNDNLVRYFFNKDEKEIKQLEYKIYEAKDRTKRYNRNYIFQLKKEINCNNADFKSVKYKEKSLSKYFIKFNSCKGNYITNNTFEDETASSKFTLKAKAGLNSSILKINDAPFSKTAPLESKVSFTFGFEGEYILPFNKNKWSIFIEPTYQSYASKETISYLDNFSGIIVTRSSTIDFELTTIDIPLGLKHYSYLNDDHKLFFSLGFTFNFPLKSSFKYATNGGTTELDVDTTPFLMFGVGYQYDKYSIEAKINTNRNVLSNYFAWNTNYSTISLVLGYQIF
jgi:hypothetical protein